MSLLSVMQNSADQIQTSMALADVMGVVKKQIETQWKSKSLDPGPKQSYTYDLKIQKPQQIEVKQDKSFFKKLFGKKQQKKSQQSSNRQILLPSPKITKINDRIFTIAIGSQLKIYFYNFDTKIKTKFDFIDYTSEQQIEFVVGYDKDKIFVATASKLAILTINRQGNNKYQITKKEHKLFSGLKGLTATEKALYAITSDRIIQFQATSNVIRERIIQFANQNDKKMYKSLNAKQLVPQDNHTLFFFGTKKDTKKQIDMKGNFDTNIQKQKECQVLVLVQFKLDQDQFTTKQSHQSNKSTKNSNDQSKNKTLPVNFYPIDFVFQTEVFMNTKIFPVANNMFILSLFQEIILIKKHFDKYVVWDNISIISSRSQSIKGQLVLADKRIMVYSQINQIYAHDIFFDEKQSKLSMPQIDSFKGNDADDQILYDALLLKYNSYTLMKVLFYFKKSSIIIPKGNRYYQNTQKVDGLTFYIICINQSDPKQKLIRLLRQQMNQQKTPQQINQFVQRFGIKDLQKYKSQWTVCNKTIKDIENSLLVISDDNYIQEELDKILKEKPHDLVFLTHVEQAQISRFKKLIVRTLFKSEQKIEQGQQSKDSFCNINNLSKYIKWLMQSMMFLKKLKYSKNFLSFKQYDFIQIGKLRATSLKEQIKLLSCKKFEKRLKYFLNSFKFLAIADYEDMFAFLLENKTVDQLYEFILSFRFIMPSFVETSNVFIKKPKTYLDIVHKVSQVAIEEFSSQSCKLWDDFGKQSIAQSTAIMMSNISTAKLSKTEDQNFSNLQNFEKMIIEEIEAYAIGHNLGQQRQQAVSTFKNLLKKFTTESWYKNSAYKQHAVLNIQTKQLADKFYYLRQEGVFKLFIKIVYRKISEGTYQQRQVQELLDKFVIDKVLPQSFRKNIQARVCVYKILERQLSKSSKINSYHVDLYLRQDFLILKEENYFQFLLTNYKRLILRDIKDVYEKIQPDFFRERLQIYFNSSLVNLKQVIDFVDEFQDSSSDSIRLDLFRCIKKRLKLDDYINTKKFNEKSLDKQIFPDERGNQLDLLDLKEQAKVPYGFYFYNFYRVLQLDYTYDNLINSSQITQLEENKLLTEIITKFTGKKYLLEDDSCLIMFEEGLTLDGMTPIDIHNNPFGFFGILLYLKDTLAFKTNEVDIFINIIDNYLNKSDFKLLKEFLDSAINFEPSESIYDERINQILFSFKVENYINKIFSETALLWIQHQYQSLHSIHQIQTKFENINSALNLIEQFSKEPHIQKEKGFFQMLRLIKKFDMNLLLKIDYLKSQLNQTGFIFMMHLLKNGNIDQLKGTNIDNIEDTLYNFDCIYSQFKLASAGQIVDSRNSQELVRFFIELCEKLILQGVYTGAQRILRKVTSSNLYFRDIVFMFLSSAKYGTILSNELNQFITEFLSTQTPSILKKKIIQITQRAQDFQKDPSYAKSACLLVFQYIMENKKPIEAFYYLHRMKNIEIMEVVDVVNDLQIYENVNLSPYFVLISYIRCLQQHLGNQFYPTFRFFQTKYEMLIAQMDRMDVIKDFNIGLSRLYSLIQQTDNMTLKNKLQKNCTEFQCFYKQFMFNINIDPYIKLTQQQFLQGSQRMDRYSRHIPPQIMKRTGQQSQARMDLKSNQQKLSMVKKNNKIDVIEKQVFATISQAKKTAQKYEQIIEERRDMPKQQSIFSKRQKQLQQMKKREREEIQSVKQSFKSTTTERVTSLIQNLRKKRAQAINQSRISERIVKQTTPSYGFPTKQEQSTQSRIPSTNYRQTSYYQTSSNRAKQQQKNEAQRQINIERLTKQKQKSKTSLQSSSRPQDIFGKLMNFGGADNNTAGKVSKKQQKFQVQSKISQPFTNFSGANNYQIKISSPKKQQVDNHKNKQADLLPVTLIGKMINSTKKTKKQESKQIQTQLNFGITQLKERLSPRDEKKKKIPYSDLQKLFNDKEPEASKYLPKIELIKTNLKVGVQLVKRIYTVCRNFSSFQRFLEYLLSSQDKFKQVIQEKSLQIVNQMIKIDVKMDYQSLLPVQLFTTIHKTSIKDYYAIAFEIIKPNMIKVLQKPNVNIHGIAILFRYGFGSQITFFYKVYEEYIRILLKNYQTTQFDEKKVFLLGEKLKNLYSNLNPDNRAIKLEQMISQIKYQQLKVNLIKSIDSQFGRKSGIQQNAIGEEFLHVISEIRRKIKA